ncbi:PTS transporter subunit EIIC [Entomoplasma freundtii]
MAVFSKLSKAFLLPIALLPIAGVFLGVGAAITSNAVSGSGVWYFGNVLNKMGDVAFGNLPILFAISTALAFTKDAGVAAITAVVGFLVMNGIQAALLHNQAVGTPNLAAAFVNGEWTYANLLESSSLDVNVSWSYYYLAGLTKGQVVDRALIDSATRVDLNGFKLDAAGKNFFELLWVKNIPNGLITSNIGVSSLNTGVLAAIFVGAISAWAYNKFHKTQLPSAISFFSGTKLVPIITFFLVIPLSFIFIFVWPWIGIGLAKFGTLSGTLPGGLDSLIYEIVERSLVPFGLHHVFYAPLWWTNAGGSISEVLTSVQEKWAVNDALTFGNSVIGGKWDLARWISEYMKAFPNVIVTGETNIDKFRSIVANISKVSDLWEAQGDQTMMYKVIANLNIINFTMLEHLGMNLGRFQSGKFGFMLLGLPLASLAMWLNVPKQNRRSVMGIYLSAAFTCFLTGITEPIEYTFLFLAPWLFYGVHMPLAAISFMLAGFLQTHVSMTVSGGFIDYIVFGLIPFFGSNAMTWLSVFGVLFIALGMSVLYFTGFYFAVRYGKVMVPGREEGKTDGETKLFTKADYKGKNHGPGQGEYVLTSDQDGQAYTSSKNPAEIAKYEKAAKIIDFLGSEDNITNVDACASRLRVDVKDSSKVQKDKIIALGGATGALVKGTNVQVVYGGEQEAIKPRMIEILAIQRSAPKPQVKVAVRAGAMAEVGIGAETNSGVVAITPTENVATIEGMPMKAETSPTMVESVGESFSPTHEHKVPILNPVVMVTKNMLATCPKCSQEFKVDFAEAVSIPNPQKVTKKVTTTKVTKTAKSKTKAKAKNEDLKVYQQIESLQTKYADLIQKNEIQNPQWVENLTKINIEERTTLDGSATILEPRQDLQKYATALRHIAKAKNFELKNNINLRNLTKAEVIRYLDTLTKDLKNL